MTQPTPAPGINTTLSPASILNAMSTALGNAANNLSGLLNSGSFDPTNPNDVTLLQIYTETLNALMSATSNAIKSVYDSATAVIRNIS